MPAILVIGYGRSSTALVDYLIQEASIPEWEVILADAKPVNTGDGITVHQLDIRDEVGAKTLIRKADVVISLLPAPFHPLVAAYCLDERRHLFTASYVSPEMRALDAEARSKHLLFLNECGLDPGLDHMSAMELISRVKAEGGVIRSFESYTGGLIAKATDPENPWRYKFTWNPTNVVLAGQSGGRFLKEGSEVFIPYDRLFAECTTIAFPDGEQFEGYANRDSLDYIARYGLEDVHTMIRGTLRYPGFCRAWNLLVRLGCCDNTRQLTFNKAPSHLDFLNRFLEGDSASAEERLMKQVGLAKDSHELACLRWSEFFSDEPVGISSGTPAAMLERILSKKWKLAPDDRDRVVMWHRVRYAVGETSRQLVATLDCTGTDSTRTAMARTVGLPLGIAVKLMLQGKIKSRGVVIPVEEEFFQPILKELREKGGIQHSFARDPGEPL